VKTVFLAGIHGVGKGFLGAPVAASLGIAHNTASQLIREEKGRATWGAGKHAAELDDNQQALVTAIERKQAQGKDLLVDGHFVLRNIDGDMICLSKDIFEKMHLCGVIVLTDEAEIIARRLEIRDGIANSVESISELAALEKMHAHHVCNSLGIKIIVIEKPDEVSLKDAVSMLLFYGDKD
jgi:adenylate kinase